MFEESGRAFIYMVHNNWLLNIVSHPKGKIGAVLIRALEPIEGIRPIEIKQLNILCKISNINKNLVKNKITSLKIYHSKPIQYSKDFIDTLFESKSI